MDKVMKVGDICNITTGKLDSNAFIDGGKYPFFTCAADPLEIDTFAFDDDVILIAGNNAQGKFHLNRYKGKFNAYQRTYVLTAKPNTNLDYIYYSLKLELKRLKDKSQGSQTKFLTMPILNNIGIKELDLPEQQKIAAVLSALDAKIELNQRINAELDFVAKTLYDYWFVQFDFPNEKGKPYKSAGGKMVWNEKLKREIPLGWEVCELRKYVTANRGLSYSGKHITGGGVPMINLNSFNMADGSYKPEGIKTYSGEYGNHKVLKPFDLVMCNTQQTALDPKKDIIGKSFLVPDIFETDIVSSHHVTTVTVEKENLKYYLNSLFNTGYFHRYISGYATGTNILGLNFEGVLSYKTAIPSDDLLDRYKAIVVNVEKQKARIVKESQTLTELRDWLLPMLMNGQVTIQTSEVLKTSEV